MKDTVIGIIYENVQNEQIVLTKRRDVPVWVLPGGGIDEGETPEQALLREMKEETGLTVAIRRKTGEYSPINRLARNVHVFECEILGGELSLCEETCDIGYFSKENYPKPLFILHQEWLQDAIDNPSRTVQRPLEGVNYWELFKFALQHPILVTRAAFARLGFPLNSRPVN